MAAVAALDPVHSFNDWQHSIGLYDLDYAFWTSMLDQLCSTLPVQQLLQPQTGSMQMEWGRAFPLMTQVNHNMSNSLEAAMAPVENQLDEVKPGNDGVKMPEINFLSTSFDFNQQATQPHRILDSAPPHFDLSGLNSTTGIDSTPLPWTGLMSSLEKKPALPTHSRAYSSKRQRSPDPTPTTLHRASFSAPATTPLDTGLPEKRRRHSEDISTMALLRNRDQALKPLPRSRDDSDDAKAQARMHRVERQIASLAQLRTRALEDMLQSFVQSRVNQKRLR